MADGPRQRRSENAFDARTDERGPAGAVRQAPAGLAARSPPAREGRRDRGPADSEDGRPPDLFSTESDNLVKVSLTVILPKVDKLI
jgi:hypothetical protein